MKRNRVQAARDPAPVCEDDRRRLDVRAASEWNGIDYVEVDESQTLLTLFFLDRAPDEIQKENVLILGGRRVTGIQVVRISVCRAKEQGRDDCLQVWVDRPGDFSTYTLCLVEVDERGRPRYEVDTQGRRHYIPLHGFDRRYACIDFTFKVNCPSDLDCQLETSCPPAPRSTPEINYLAKDYASFRQLIFDRMAVTLPDWKERHVPDLGVTLVELLAYAGDYLSYYQDAVATEAYIGTARQRISVRRHARLVDYRLSEGCNARAWLCIQTSEDEIEFDPSKIYFTTTYSLSPSAPRLVNEDALRASQPGPYLTFEPLVEDVTRPLRFYQAHNRIRLYTWGDAECCLPKGSTSAVLYDGIAVAQPPPPPPDPKHQSTGRAQRHPAAQQPQPSEGDITYQRELRLQPGDFLLFEETIGPRTGDPADADPRHRHVVRLSRVSPVVDELYHQPLLEVEWAAADALPFPLCISSLGPAPECPILVDVSVACGNVLLVDHGQTIWNEPLNVVEIKGSQPVCEDGCPDPVELIARPFTPTLQKVPLTFAQQLPAEHNPMPAARLLAQDPHRALPLAKLVNTPGDPDGLAPVFRLEELQSQGLLEALAQRALENGPLYWLLSPATRKALAAWGGGPPLPVPLGAALVDELLAHVQSWQPRADLFESHPQDHHFVAEIDNDGIARLRFGDDDLGSRPQAGQGFYATYRVGNGPDGNVGAGTITTIVLRGETIQSITLEASNPLPASGGTAPETLTESRLLAPHAFRSVIERAITPADYATLVMKLFPDQVQRAAAAMRWTGSWYEAWVAVDPLVSTTGEVDTLLRKIHRTLERYRRVDHDLVVREAEDVPVELTMTVCVLPNYLVSPIKSELLALFSNRRLPNGRLGFFHPDNLTLGQGVALSKIVALARAVIGVESVQVTALHPFGQSPNSELENGILPLGPFQVARLDNDPNYPENGQFKLEMVGGR